MTLSSVVERFSAGDDVCAENLQTGPRGESYSQVGMFLPHSPGAERGSRGSLSTEGKKKDTTGCYGSVENCVLIAGEGVFAFF